MSASTLFSRYGIVDKNGFASRWLEKKPGILEKFVKEQPDAWKEIETKRAEWPDLSLSQIINSMSLELTRRACKNCGKLTPYHSSLRNFAECCSVSCAVSHRQKEKVAAGEFKEFWTREGSKKGANNARLSVKKKYGVSNVSQLNDVKEKISQERKSFLKTQRDKRFSGIDLQTEYEELPGYLIAEKYGMNATSLYNKMREDGIEIERKVGSSYEDRISALLSANGIEHVRNDRKILDGLELDIYVPSKQVGIEIHGSYWHKDKSEIHMRKLRAAEAKGVSLIQFYDYEYLTKSTIINSIILAKLGGCIPLYARNCQLVKLNGTPTEFLEQNHLQGNVARITHSYGLFHDEQMVMVMCLGKSRFGRQTDGYEILRMCSKKFHRVVGGASKLFSAFVKEVSPKEVESFADRKWGSAKSLYNALGFDFSHYTKPGFCYVKMENNKVVDVKSRFSSWGKGDPKGYFKLWDCGQEKYTMRKFH